MSNDLPKFYGRGRFGKWYMINAKAGLVPFGSAGVLVMEDCNNLIEWYHHFLSTGKGILLPMYQEEKLIWISTN